MKKIILGEEQSKKLANILRESEQEVYKMPVDKKVNKPYCIDPEKVLIVKKYLDDGFSHKDLERVGANGYPEKIKIVSMNTSLGQPLKYMYTDQVKDLLIDKFQNMFSDKVERDLFMGQVLKDWCDDAISPLGLLTTNRLLQENMTKEEINAEAENTNTSPTDAQKEAGNYKMGHISVKGMKIAIENPKGSKRYYGEPDSDGNRKYNVMQNHYGYFNITKGKDGDAVDVFIGPDIDDFDTVYCIDQNMHGEFDETKVMLGFSSEKEAKDAYFANFSKDWKGFRAITAVSLKDFKKWLYRGRKQRQPFADYAAIKKCKLNESVLNEEEYNEVVPIARAYDEDSAQEISMHLIRNGIESYAEDNIVYAMIEQDRNDPHYVDDVKKYAKKIAREFYQSAQNQVHHQIAEGIEDFNPLDVYQNGRKFGDEPEEENEGWVKVRNSENGKYNLKDIESSELLINDWFDWIGEMTNGFVVVMKNEEGYNIVSEEGEYVLKNWHEDIQEMDGYKYQIIDGNNVREISILDFE
jgi:hypothetical protein